MMDLSESMEAENCLAGYPYRLLSSFVFLPNSHDSASRHGFSSADYTEIRVSAVVKTIDIRTFSTDC